jgi:hypothetical protein
MRVKFSQVVSPSSLLRWLCIPVLALGAQVSSYAQTSSPAVTMVYEADNSVFANPERGFYRNYQPLGGGQVGQQDTPHAPFTVAELRALRGSGEAITLVRDNILIPRKFWTQPLSQQYLNELQANFDAVREAGLKCVPRFLYDWGMQNRDPEEAIVKSHLNQLAPLLQKNADVIAWVQGGLFGGTGEQCASDHNFVYPKYPASSGSIMWQGLSSAGTRLLLQELRLTPADRMMVVRYPRLKWDLFGWTSQTALGRAMASGTAYTQSDASRVGFYNDGFMGSPEHYAMFQLANEGQFTAQDAGFVVHEGEISDASDYKLKAGQVTRDIEKYHLTALNAGGDAWQQVSQKWRSNGDFDGVAQRLGYRFRLINSTLAKTLSPGSTFALDLQMTNDGVARAHNPRGVEVVLRGKTSKFEHRIKVDEERGNRLWLPGPGEMKSLQVSAKLPATMPTDDYEVLLNLPDPYPSLYNRPEYSIRLANRNVWEPTTGFNKLLSTLRVQPAAGGVTPQVVVLNPTPTPAPTPQPEPTPTPSPTSQSISQPVPVQTEGNGLLGTYYDTQNFSGASFSRIDSQVNFNWNGGAPVQAMGTDTFSARWIGHVRAQRSETYTFYMRCDDGVRLWVDGKLLINQWQTQNSEYSAPMTLTAGKKFDIKVEYYDNTGNAAIQLSWASPSMPKQIIPRTQLYTP